MAKNTIRDFDTNAGSNTDIGGISIQGTASPSNLDNGMRQSMKILADWNTGAEAVDDTATFGDPVDPTKRVRLDAGNVATATTRTMFMPDSDITWGAFGVTLAALADAAAARTAVGVDAAGTDNSTDVTLDDTSYNYLSIIGQEIALGAIDLAADVTGVLPTVNIADGAITAVKASIASQAQAEAGTDDTTLMTPQRVSQAIAALAPEAPATGFQSMQVFTSSGTWTRPSGITKVLMIITGGGGGAGDGGAGAGSAATAIKFLDVSSIATATITVGSGGSGNSGSGNNGGASSWADGTNTITGGGGGAGDNFYGGSGGAATSGDINNAGARGGSQPDGAAGVGGHGGASFWGGGGGAGTDSVSSNGLNGAAYGSGGGGTSSSSGTGGTGRDGIVWVLEFA